MIVRVPKYKKLNEGYFDDLFDEHDEELNNDSLLSDTETNADMSSFFSHEGLKKIPCNYKDNTKYPEVIDNDDYVKYETYISMTEYFFSKTVDNKYLECSYEIKLNIVAQDSSYYDVIMIYIDNCQYKFFIKDNNIYVLPNYHYIDYKYADNKIIFYYILDLLRIFIKYKLKLHGIICLTSDNKCCKNMTFIERYTNTKSNICSSDLSFYTIDTNVNVDIDDYENVTFDMVIPIKSIKTVTICTEIKKNNNINQTYIKYLDFIKRITKCKKYDFNESANDYGLEEKYKTLKNIFDTWNNAQNNKKKVNESFFDDMFDEHDEPSNDNSIFGDELSLDDIAQQLVQDDVVSTYGKEYEEKKVKPYVEKLLNHWNITDYELTCTGKGVRIDVHDHLYLSNKQLYTIKNPDWYFGTVDGNCIFSNNKLTSWDLFPKVIKGDCIANLNNLTNFYGAPEVHGYMEASKQNKKTDYPLTQENYNNRFIINNIVENSVYIISKDMFGTLKDINESKSYCVVKGNNGKLYKCKLDDVNCLDTITNLIL